ncbi:hypothetical protein LA080_001304 [Diaporthe eres]|nr:hypothetical protein LA080_001304 [Diaporthe eres]
MAHSQDIVYRGNCVCGRYRYEICLPDVVRTASSCTCSVCLKKGYLWLAPPEGSFKFCDQCGIGVVGLHTAGPLSGHFTVNVRTIQGVNPFKIHITAVETEDEEPKIQRPAATEPVAHHLFSCQCGDVQAELLVPIHDQEIKEDNCSGCVRDAYIGVYPTRDQVRIHGRERGWEYGGLKAELGALKMGSVVHCKTCGVQVFTNLYGPPTTVFDKLSPERKAYALEVYHKNTSLQPLNVRAVEGFQLLSETININRSDEGTEGYAELLEPWQASPKQAEQTGEHQTSN